MAVAAERGYASGANTGIATTDVAIPTGVNVDDWIIVFLVTSGGAITITTPTGWTLLGASGAVNTRSYYAFAKRKASGDPSTVTFTQSAASAVSWTLAYGSGGLTDISQWTRRTYPNDTGQANPFDKRYTYYLEKGGSSAPSGTAATTRVRGMAVPAKSLVLTFMGEATTASETEAQVTLIQGAAKWFFYGGGASINTHWWSKEYTATAKTTDDVIVKWPNDNNANGAGMQLAIPELVESTPPVNLQATFDSGVTSPFSVHSAGTSRFEKAASSARSGSAGQRRVSGTEANHAQSVTPEVYTPTAGGYRYVGYVRIDTATTPSLAGLTIGAASDGSGGIQAIVDTRNGTASGSAGGTSSLQLRSNMGSSTLAASGALAAIVSGIWYRIEMDWFPGSPSVKARFYEDATGKFLGALEGGTTVTSGGVGYYGYGSASYDDISLTPIPTTPRLATKAALPDGSIGDVLMTYFDGGKEVNPTRVEYSHKGTLVPELLSTSRVWTMAHRGGSLDYQEHTMRGYYQSTVAHADVIEISLVVSKDGTFWCAHDREPDRTTSGLAVAGKYFSDYTDAEISAMVQNLPNRGDSRFGNDRYYKLSEILAQYGQGTHGVMIDPKYITGTNLTNLINYLKTFANYQNIFIGKFFHTGISIAQLFSNAGMITWGYGYEEAITGLKSDGSATTDPLFSATAQYWTMLGLNYEAPASVWAQMMTIAGSKKVIAHICPTAAAADIGVSKGAKAIQASGINSVSTKY
jgi:hypothetical protein